MVESSGGANGSEETEDFTWPSLQDALGSPETLDLRKALFQSQLDVEKARQLAELVEEDKARAAANADSAKAEYAAYYAKMQSVFAAYVDTTKAAIDRAQARAMYINTVASAISALYTGILAFRFVSKVDDKAAPNLPLRGFVPVLFLAVAIVLATVYLSYLSQRRDTTTVKTSGNLVKNADYALEGYICWVKEIIEPRLPFLHGAVVSLGLGVAALPIAFVSFGRLAVWLPYIIVIAFATPFIVIIIETLIERRQKTG